MKNHVFVVSFRHLNVWPCPQKKISSSQSRSLPDLRTMEMASFTSSGFSANEQVIHVFHFLLLIKRTNLKTPSSLQLNCLLYKSSVDYCTGRVSATRFHL